MTHEESEVFRVRSTLFVTTVPITLRAFLLPFAEMLGNAGWRVDAASSDLVKSPGLDEWFDRRFDVPWSRSPLAPSNVTAAPSRIREIVERGEYDVVWVHTPIAAFVTRFALRGLPRRTRPTIIYTSHGFHFHSRQNPIVHRIYHALERRAAAWTDLLVTVNAEDFAAARSFPTIPHENVRHIPGIGVDTFTYTPGSVGEAERVRRRTALGLSADLPLITMIAEGTPNKRHALALTALADMKRPANLAFVGVEGSELGLADLAHRLRVSSRVAFLGYRHDVVDILQVSNAALLVSAREGLPRSILEAMSCGVPAVGTRTRGIVDAIGDDSLIADWDDAVGLARILDSLFSDPVRARALGEAARTRVVDRFALPGIESAYRALYDEAAAMTDARRG